MSEAFRVTETAAIKTRKKRVMHKEEVTETILDNGVLKKAIELSEGHPGRIEILDEKSAIVWNSQKQKHDMQAQRMR